jgi:uncharacterized protein
MTDVGLAASLLGIRDAQQMQLHPLRGALFETMVANELLKNRCNMGSREPIYYWRDNSGTEVNFVLEQGTEIAAVEVTSGISVASDAFNNLKRWHTYARERGNSSAIHLGLVYGGDKRFKREAVDVMPWLGL